jgi:hypothetical protein
MEECTICKLDGRIGVIIIDEFIYGICPVEWLPELPDQSWVKIGWRMT